MKQISKDCTAEARPPTKAQDARLFSVHGELVEPWELSVSAV